MNWQDIIKGKGERHFYIENGKPVQWIGRHPEEKYANRYGENYDGWYSRSIGGGDHMKILLGGVGGA